MGGRHYNIPAPSIGTLLAAPRCNARDEENERTCSRMIGHRLDEGHRDRSGEWSSSPRECPVCKMSDLEYGDDPGVMRAWEENHDAHCSGRWADALSVSASSAKEDS